MTGILYLMPNALGPGALQTVLPATTISTAAGLGYYVGEDAKSTRAFLKRIDEVVPLCRPIREIEIAVLDVSTPAGALAGLLEPIVAGRDGGLVSEAGSPAVADPGATLIRLAHARGIPVRPLVGPSAILLALMACGLDGQRFAFNGYLPADARERIVAIREAERRSAQLGQTQVWIETPYRNQQLFTALIEHSRPDTLLSIACDLTLASETIATRSAREWREHALDLHRRPTIFLMLAR